MTTSFAQRLLSITSAVVLTVAMLGGVNHLAAPEQAAQGWAQSSTPVRG
ncbi:MAG: hypothetical protein ACOVQT_00900 [Rubrivivax sp.]|jgi:hypothetical protein